MSVPAQTHTQHDIDHLIARLGDPDGLVRHAARVAIVTAGLPTVHALIATLASPNDNARWEAARALTQLRDPEAADALVQCLIDDVPDIRWLAAEALDLIGRPALEPVLRGLLEHSGSPWFREGAHHVLHSLGKGDLKQLLQPVLHALDGIEPAIAVLVPAHELLELLAPTRPA